MELAVSTEYDRRVLRRARRRGHLLPFLLLLIPFFELIAQLDVRIENVVTTNYPEIEVFFSVRRNGALIQQFSPTDLSLYEDGEFRQPEFLYCDSTAEGTTVSVLLILDKSGSMAGLPLFDAKNAAISFVGRLRSADEVGVIAFDTFIETVAPFTTDKVSVIQAIENIRLGDRTNLWGACRAGIDMITSRPHRKAIVLLTDGYHNPDIVGETADSVIDLAKSRGIPFFSIGLGEAVDSTALKTLSAQTGGRYFTSPSSADLLVIYNLIAQIINTKGLCALRYTSNLPCLDGQNHEIILQVALPGTVGEAVSSFIAPLDVSTVRPVTLDLPKDLIVESGSTISIPLSITGLQQGLPLRNLRMTVLCDTELVTLSDVSLVGRTNSFSLDFQRTGSDYRITLDGDSPLPGDGTILEITLTAAERWSSLKSNLALVGIQLSNPCLSAVAGGTTVTISGSCQRALSSPTREGNQAVSVLHCAPSPVRTRGMVTFRVERGEWLSLRLMNIFGAPMWTDPVRWYPPGVHMETVPADGLPPGIYLFSIGGASATVTQKILVVP